MAIGATKPAVPAAVADAARGRGVEEEELVSAPTLPPGPASSDGPRIPAGTMIADRYRIARVLGEGGMGVVYAAEHVLMRKEVAVKVLHADMCTMPEVVARFEREAIAAAHIDHPNVAGATDFGRLPDGSCYLVLELLRGKSLREEIAHGPIPRLRALGILRGIVSGVSAAHLKGIVHRDLKPENVMLASRDGIADFVKVLDFGIAKVDTSVAAAPQAGASRILTRVGAVFGTPEYMAPEQAVGDTVDARADLYSIGVLFLEMLTGKCPFEGNAMSILRERILAVGPPDMSGIEDPGDRAVVAKLLAREPDDRMQTAAELITAIDGLLEPGKEDAVPLSAGGPRPSGLMTVPPASMPAVATPRTAETSSRTRWVIPLVIAASLSIGAGAILMVTMLGRTTRDVSEIHPARTTKTLPATAELPSSEAVMPLSGQASDSGTAAMEPPVQPPAPPPSSTTSMHAMPRKPASKPARSAPQPKKGASGINIPPPKEWFK